VLNRQLNKLLCEADNGFKELKALAKSDKELSKLKDADFIDAFYTKYEKEITKIEKKYNLDAEELGSMLTKL
jgi:hypothetical protein